MIAVTKMIRTTGRVNKSKGLVITELPLDEDTPVEVIIIPGVQASDEISEEEWLRAAARNPVFADWDDPERKTFTRLKKEFHSMNIGKIFLVPFPWDDFSSLKVRPTLCLSEPVGEHRQMVVAYIGSKIPSELMDTDVVTYDDPDVEGTGLHKTSVIRVHRLITVTPERRPE